ncbi:MAG: hypothetical protein ACE5J0_01800 [Candidatus Paceibacterales bacterium]
MPFLEFHLTNILSYYGFASPLVNLGFIFGMSAATFLYILVTWFIIRYLKQFYGERPVPREWKIFWWAFIFYNLHEILEIIGVYQFVLGKAFFVFLTTTEITSAVLLTWACYLLVKTYVLKG